MFKFEPSKSFTKNLKKLTTNEQKAVRKKLEIMAKDPFYPSLRTKKVQSLKNIFEASVNMDIRILWKHKDDKVILLIDIGHHDILG